MRRALDLSSFAPTEIHEYGGVQDFLATPIRDGVSSIMIGTQPFHLLYRDRGADTTAVIFAAALPKEGWDTYPVFAGQNMVAGLNVNHLALSDPNFALQGRPPTGWFLGNDHHPLYKHMSSIIRHATKAGVEGQSILFGSSAGGFAALYYGAQIPESVTVCINPRVELLNEPTQFPRLVPLAFPESERNGTLVQIPTSAGAVYAHSASNTVAYIQNVQDKPYFEGNFLPFLDDVEGAGDVWVNLVDSGPGHRLPGGTHISDLLRSLVDHAPHWSAGLQSLGYKPNPSRAWALRMKNEMLSTKGIKIGS